mmetsp:Transcript_47688/g.138952  ORF Transcript_47688/g.138952 Transcript_47688/m.138952 type:complete len:223 (-) Transcript_47688:1291-1959(-)
MSGAPASCGSPCADMAILGWTWKSVSKHCEPCNPFAAGWALTFSSWTQAWRSRTNSWATDALGSRSADAPFRVFSRMMIARVSRAPSARHLPRILRSPCSRRRRASAASVCSGCLWPTPAAGSPGTSSRCGALRPGPRRSSAPRGGTPFARKSCPTRACSTLCWSRGRCRRASRAPRRRGGSSPASTGACPRKVTSPCPPCSRAWRMSERRSIGLSIPPTCA